MTAGGDLATGTELPAEADAEVRRDANRLSNVLAAMGVMSGDCVAIVLAPSRELAVSRIACGQMGAVVLAVSPSAAPAELERQLAQAAPRVAIVDAAALATLLPLRAGLPRLRHVLGIGAVADDVRAWEVLLPLASPHYAAVAAAPPLLHTHELSCRCKDPEGRSLSLVGGKKHNVIG